MDLGGVSSGSGVGCSVGVGGVMIGCTKRSCVPGKTRYRNMMVVMALSKVYLKLF